MGGEGGRGRTGLKIQPPMRKNFSRTSPDLKKIMIQNRNKKLKQGEAHHVGRMNPNSDV